MKKYFILFLFLFCGQVFSQESANFSQMIAITLDSTDSEVFFVEFYSGNRNKPSQTAFDPRDAVRRTNDLAITVQIDSLKANNVGDSTTLKIEFLDRDGYLTGENFWVDFTTSNDSSNAAIQNTYTPFNRTTATLGTTSSTWWADLSALIRPHYYGIKGTLAHTGDLTAASPDSAVYRITIHKGINGFRN